MHWLSSQVERLEELSGERRAFLAAVEVLVAEVAARDGVVAAFAFLEGLLVATAGDAGSFEALAARAQACLEPASDAADALALGSLRQLVLVAEDDKLALVRLGGVTLGIRCPATTDLSRALA